MKLTSGLPMKISTNAIAWVTRPTVPTSRGVAPVDFVASNLSLLT